MKKIIPQSIKNIYHLFQAILANFWYGFPSRKIKIIGVTGTNGKTTTVQMIAKVLEEAGYKVAVNSTINFKIGGKEWVNKTKFTTLSSFKVQKFISDAVKEKCDYLVLETSSHSLDQYRVWGIKYEVAVITNVTREHLDYHQDMENYRKAKCRLFEKANVAIVNLDMEKPEEYLDCGAREKYGFTTQVQSSKFKVQNSRSELKVIGASEINLGISESEFEIATALAGSRLGGKNLKFSISLPGLFNVENALAAVCVGLSQNINLETISKALEKIKGIPGRMEYVPNSKGLNIIVDYAVTPDSLEKLYGLIKHINAGNNKIISVFGACGERDRGKRPIMGKIVSNCADYVFVTNEDSYNEDPGQIINEVAGGIRDKKENENFWKILDRREAIKKALALAKTGDFIVITGKGAEEIMAVGNKRIEWNDKKVILEELERL
jgi:UDP-N-acetylmuramoyl-L-alanyl-D-glutamate--2,6-diaminopimelate ligase